MHINRVIGFQNFTSQSLTSVVTVSTQLLTDTKTGERADAAVFSVGGSTGSIRFRDDGGVPSASVGMRLPSTLQPYVYTGDLHKLQFIADAVAGNADLNIDYVKINDT